MLAIENLLYIITFYLYFKLNLLIHATYITLQ